MKRNGALSRRGFLGGAALAAGGLVCKGAAAAEAGSEKGKALRVCVFADLHYNPGVWTNTEDRSFLERILARAKAAQCDMVIHLGDLVHGVGRAEEKELIRAYNGFSLPTYHVLGNHDQDHNPWEETVKAYGMPGGHYSFDRGGFRFIVLDPNYFRTKEGEFVHYSSGNNYSKPAGATAPWIPTDQLAWLREILARAPGPCVVLSHQSLEKCTNYGGSVTNGADEARRIFAEANARRPGAVRLVINGNDHLDFLRVLDGILYWDVNSANYQYYDKVHTKYPAAYMKTHARAGNNIGWKDPLSAILTLEPGGRIRIEGSESDWLFGVSPQDAGEVQSYTGRRVTAKIQTVDFTFDYSRHA